MPYASDAQRKAIWAKRNMGAYSIHKPVMHDCHNILKRIDTTLKELVKTDKVAHTEAERMRTNVLETIDTGQLRKQDLNDLLAVGAVNRREYFRLKHKLKIKD